MVLMVGVLIDMSLMKTMELLEIGVNHWFPSNVHPLFPERLKLACKRRIERFHASLSPTFHKAQPFSFSLWNSLRKITVKWMIFHRPCLLHPVKIGMVMVLAFHPGTEEAEESGSLEFEAS